MQAHCRSNYYKGLVFEKKSSICYTNRHSHSRRKCKISASYHLINMSMQSATALGLQATIRGCLVSIKYSEFPVSHIFLIVTLTINILKCLPLREINFRKCKGFSSFINLGSLHAWTGSEGCSRKCPTFR